MTRSRLVLVALALAAAGAAVLGRRAAEPPPRAAPRAVEELVDPLPESIFLRILAKQHLAREAGAGRRPLAEAAALFGALNRLPPELAVPAYARWAADTEGERLCRQVIDYAGVPGPDWPPAKAAAAAARLEAELADDLSRHGAVRLPDPAVLPPAEGLLEEARGRLTEAQRRAWLPAPRDDAP